MTAAHLPTAGPDIVPTHTCFDDALDYFGLVLDPARADIWAPYFRVVHGICSAGGPGGSPYAHAWVEQRECRRWFQADAGENPMPDVIVWQAGRRDGADIYWGMDAEAFRLDFGVQRATVYTLRLAVEMNRITGHYGPWRRDYRDLCRQSGDGRIVGRVTSSAPCIVWPVDRSLLGGR